MTFCSRSQIYAIPTNLPIFRHTIIPKAKEKAGNLRSRPFPYIEVISLAYLFSTLRLEVWPSRSTVTV